MSEAAARALAHAVARVVVNRVSRDGWNEDLLKEVVDILDDAAKKIERAKSGEEAS